MKRLEILTNRLIRIKERIIEPAAARINASRPEESPIRDYDCIVEGYKLFDLIIHEMKGLT